jgi:hypothetical protein
MRYDYKQLAELLGADRQRIANIVSQYKVEKIVDDNRVFFSESAVEEIKKYLNTRPGKKFYKVSVFNEHLGKFIVKSVCRPYEDARRLCHQLTAAGFLARYSLHKSKKYYYE